MHSDDIFKAHTAQYTFKRNNEKEKTQYRYIVQNLT